MLDTNKFVNQLVAKGYSHLCVVPCSFAKNLINASINYSHELEYVPCASEAVACSIAEGSNAKVQCGTIVGRESLILCISKLSKTSGFSFVHVKCSYDDEMPRPPLEVIKRIDIMS